MRLLLLTGTGGAGTTTLAAATALRAARAGVKTLLVAPRPPLDPAAGPGAALGLAPAALDRSAREPVEAEPGLSVRQAGARESTRSAWAALSAPLRGLLGGVGADAADEAEFIPPPGVAEVLALLALRDAAAAGWDLVVADLGPLDAALGLVALPAAGARLIERLLPIERRMRWAMGHGPIAVGSVAGAPWPGVPPRAAVAAAEHLQAELASCRDLLAGPSAAARLVVPAEPVALAQALRARTALALQGVGLEALVVNRLVPAGAGGGWLAERAAAQGQVLADAARAVAPVPVVALGERAGGLHGPDALAGLAGELAGPGDAREPGDPDPAGGARPVVERDGSDFVLVLALPGARRQELELARRGDELLVDLAGTRRALALPAALRRCDVTGARLRDGALRVTFRPDPALWRSP